MPTKRMLIDASHPEETRVVVVDGTRLEEYDVEVATRRQLKGNIYLAKVTRVEPSLQAAFVEYGGNRHGFLAFNEIHPDYYQIPVADRERLLAEEAAMHAAISAEPEDQGGEEGEVQEVGGDDEDEIEQRRQVRFSRQYKIQEVVKRRQIMLVQVSKEERGNKGAALTTYLSLAGRYCVLMPNTARGGGISRKIANAVDRKRLKKILSELEVPEGMAVIVRTAGAGRSKAEIKRDYEYMMRLWSNIRETTLSSMAPALVYEEGNLIKRSLRDLYERDIEEIIIQGEPEYKVAREFMKLFIPSHAKRVKLFEDTQKPLFPAYSVEDQLDAMHQPIVQLRSGGYIVITSTEALVSIDVNSGRATRERHIEETALRTNLEAADEVARQLRLRDLAGLIVIDFIDMENARNQGLVERRMKEAMKGDRARTQIGRISAFGLLELSRQRLRPSLLETSFEQCPHCRGMGVRRTTESTTLLVLRKIEEEGLKHKAAHITVATPPTVAMYLLNQKRQTLAQIEGRFGLGIAIAADPTLMPPDYRIERSKLPHVARGDEETAIEPAGETGAEVEAEETAEAVERDEAGKRSRRRRGRRRGRRGDEEAVALDAGGEAGGEVEEAFAGQEEEPAAIEADFEEAGDEGDEAAEERAADGGKEKAGEPGRKRRRRGKRGGRRRGRRGDEAGIEAGEAAGEIGDEAAAFAGSLADAEDADREPDEVAAAADAPLEGADEAPESGDAESGEADSGEADSGEAGEVAADAADKPARKPAKPRARRPASGRTPRKRGKAAAEAEPESEAPAEAIEPPAEAIDVPAEAIEPAAEPQPDLAAAAGTAEEALAGSEAEAVTASSEPATEVAAEAEAVEALGDLDAAGTGEMPGEPVAARAEAEHEPQAEASEGEAPEGEMPEGETPEDEPRGRESEGEARDSDPAEAEEREPGREGPAADPMVAETPEARSGSDTERAEGEPEPEPEAEAEAGEEAQPEAQADEPRPAEPAAAGADHPWDSGAADTPEDEEIAREVRRGWWKKIAT